MEAQTTTVQGLGDRVREQAHALGFELCGITPLRSSDHAAVYETWLAAGNHGEMSYLARPDALERRFNPGGSGARSAIVLGLNYAAPDGGDVDASQGVIARYARGRDYHRVIRAKLLRMLRWLEGETGTRLPLARACVDTAPVLERELARRAGLGWFGRNTMIVNSRRGSYFFLSTLLVELEFDSYDEPFGQDHCGTCHACVSACPTGALLGRDAGGAPVMDARRCISYQTIENRGPIPRELRPLIGNRIFGCDICQEACPFTRRFSRPTSEPSFASRAPGEPPFGVQIEPRASTSHPGTLSPPLIALLETALDEAAWDAFSRGSALRRSGRAGFARNVCVALGNWASPDAVPVLTEALRDQDPLVRVHAVWALSRIHSRDARSALSARAMVEDDESVRSELAAVGYSTRNTNAIEEAVVETARGTARSAEDAVREEHESPQGNRVVTGPGEAREGRRQAVVAPRDGTNGR